MCITKPQTFVIALSIHVKKLHSRLKFCTFFTHFKLMKINFSQQLFSKENNYFYFLGLNFHMVTTLSTAGMHIICQLMLLMHVVFMQVPNSKNFPHFLHCFNQENFTEGQRIFKCGEEGQNYFQSTSLVLASVGIQLFLLLEMILNAAFNSDWKTVMKTSSLTEEEKSKSNLA